MSDVVDDKVVDDAADASQVTADKPTETEVKPFDEMTEDEQDSFLTTPEDRADEPQPTDTAEPDGGKPKEDEPVSEPAKPDGKPAKDQEPAKPDGKPIEEPTAEPGGTPELLAGAFVDQEALVKGYNELKMRLDSTSRIDAQELQAMKQQMTDMAALLKKPEETSVFDPLDPEGATKFMNNMQESILNGVDQRIAAASAQNNDTNPELSKFMADHPEVPGVLIPLIAEYGDAHGIKDWEGALPGYMTTLGLPTNNGNSQQQQTVDQATRQANDAAAKKKAIEAAAGLDPSISDGGATSVAKVGARTQKDFTDDEFMVLPEEQQEKLLLGESI